MANPLGPQAIMTEPMTPDMTDEGESDVAPTEAAEEDEEELDPCERSQPIHSGILE